MWEDLKKAKLTSIFSRVLSLCSCGCLLQDYSPQRLLLRSVETTFFYWRTPASTSCWILGKNWVNAVLAEYPIEMVLIPGKCKHSGKLVWACLSDLNSSAKADACQVKACLNVKSHSHTHTDTRWTLHGWMGLFMSLRMKRFMQKKRCDGELFF